MSVGPLPSCADCALYRSNEGGLVDDSRATCAAFPGGIPDEILFEGFDHRKPFPGDGGIRFTPAT